ncbi:MAG TPA: hypothetical protein PKC28_05645 [Bdellovibrionales bacterium]|nr:hypothetical protein [Bdellovibrionales bacterium]
MENNMVMSITEHQHISEMHDTLRRKLMESQRKEVTRIDSVRGAVLGSVVSENYDRAKEDLETYVEMKTAYPGFQERCERYVQHCVELIQAIKTKRNFPGLATLSLAKQQEIHAKVIEHFEELKRNLRQIEKVEREHKLADVRSTVWVLRMICQVAAAIVVVAFLKDLNSGMFSSAITVTDAFVDDASTWVVELISF